MTTTPIIPTNTFYDLRFPGKKGPDELSAIFYDRTFFILIKDENGVPHFEWCPTGYLDDSVTGKRIFVNQIFDLAPGDKVRVGSTYWSFQPGEPALLPC